MKASTLAVFLLSVTICASARADVEQQHRALPDNNLAYPVLLETKADYGSGFYLRTAKFVYFVTTNHVLFSPTTGMLLATKATLLSYSRDPRSAGKNILNLDLALLLRSGQIKTHAKTDVAVISNR